MKKTLAILAAVAVAGGAMADIAVDLQNPGGAFFGFAGGDASGQALVQLVWNDKSNPQPDSGYQVGLSLLAPGDVILSQFTTTAGFQGTWSNLGDRGGIYTDSTDAYLTVRVFDAANLGAGALGMEFDVDIDGTLATYNAGPPADPLTIMQASVTGGNFSSLVAGTPNVVEVIPEPATIGLMGVAGLGMFLARRKARR